MSANRLQFWLQFVENRSIYVCFFNFFLTSAIEYWYHNTIIPIYRKEVDYAAAEHFTAGLGR